MQFGREDYNNIEDINWKIPELEPVFLIRAQDKLAVDVLRFYAVKLKLAGGDPKMVESVNLQADRMEAWITKKVATL